MHPSNMGVCNFDCQACGGWLIYLWLIDEAKFLGSWSTTVNLTNVMISSLRNRGDITLVTLRHSVIITTSPNDVINLPLSYSASPTFMCGSCSGWGGHIILCVQGIHCLCIFKVLRNTPSEVALSYFTLVLSHKYQAAICHGFALKGGSSGMFTKWTRFVL